MSHLTHSRDKGFTLIELAIALMVIGLLIAGVLKGQEMIDNARIVAGAKQITDYETATTIFRTNYGGLPGDIREPQYRVPNCTTAPCNISGNKNNQIGQTYSTGSTYLFSNENNTYWHQLYAAKLVSQIGHDTGYSASTPEQGAYPQFFFASILDLRYYERAPDAIWTEGRRDHYFVVANPNSIAISLSGASGAPVGYIAKLDFKMDDGKPWTGKVSLSSAVSCGMTGADTEYDVNSATTCGALVTAGF